MATTRIMPLHTGKGRTVGKAIEKIIDYAENPQKTDGGRLISCFQCNSTIADAEFLFSKKQYLAKTGRQRGADDVIAYHFRQSFVPGEVTPEQANRIGYEFASRFTKGHNAFIVCTHIDKEHIHNHIIWNSTNLDCMGKFRNFWGSTRAARRLSDTLCIENGLSIVADPQGQGKSYDEWLGSKPPSNREKLRVAIDAALAQDPASMDALFALLRQNGCVVKPGKNPSLRLPGMARFARLDTLGDGYALPQLQAVISGQRKHIPHGKKPVPVRQPAISLVVDIQRKLKEGKGAGYARWAKTFNLKQMAKAMNYLNEHQVPDYAALAEQTAAATARFNALSARLKEQQTKLAQNALLQKQIVAYAKTRDTYVAYRKAGYSKKFLAEHEEEIMLHKAAKKAFDDLGVKKLPTMKSLKAEYAVLLAEKKSTYAAYQQARAEMRELLTVKANIDRLLEVAGQPAALDRQAEQREQ